MPNLRQIVDGKVILAQAPTALPAPPASPVNKGNGKKGNGKASPMAQHISQHMQDPVGATKDQFNKLQQTKLQYDQAREETQRNLAPVQSVIDHLSQMHGIQPGMPTPGMQPGSSGMQDNPDANQEYDEFGNPINTQQTVGNMNQNRPSMVGHQPGVAPGDQQTVRPPKMGVPKPGQGNPTAGSGPQPGGQANKNAAPPKGSGKMPGAKGPGDPKVANRTKKAQTNSSRQIKVHIAAAAVSTTSIPVIKASRTIETQFGL